MDPDLERALHTLEAATATLTPRQLAEARPDKWCAGQIVEHCALAVHGTARLLQWHLDKGRTRQEQPTEKQQTMIRFLIDGGRFPAGLQAPPFAVPRGMSADEVVPFFRGEVAALDAAVVRCAEQFGRQVTLGRHPVLGPLTLSQWCQFHAVHVSHHAAQIEELGRWQRGIRADGVAPR